MFTRRLSPVLLLLSAALAFFLGACSNYRLGTGAKLAFNTLYIAPVQSETLLPQSRALIGAQLRETFLRDGRITLVNTAAEAEATLSLTLKSFNRRATVAKASDAGLGRKFDLSLATTCDLALRDGTKLLDQRPITVSREDYTDLGQIQAEYEMVPVIAEKLATEVSHAVLDTW